MRWLWIDRIIELSPGERLCAIKHVSLAEEHLFVTTGGVPVMPTSLIIEGMAQTAGLLVGHAGGFREKVLLAKIQRATLDREATPGCTLFYEATLTRMDPQGAACCGTVCLRDQGEPTRIGTIDLLFTHLDNARSDELLGDTNFVFGESFRTLLRLSGIQPPDEVTA